MENEDGGTSLAGDGELTISKCSLERPGGIESQLMGYANMAHDSPLRFPLSHPQS